MTVCEGTFLASSLQLHDNGTLYLNPDSWNKVANMLYLESPGGVGYSYATAYGNPVSDNQVSPFRFCLHKRLSEG